jgi:hypothetical protein
MENADFLEEADFEEEKRDYVKIFVQAVVCCWQSVWRLLGCSTHL